MEHAYEVSRSAPPSGRPLQADVTSLCSQLKDKLQTLIDDDKPTRIDVLHWIGRCTLDIIGRAGTSLASPHTRTRCPVPDCVLHSLARSSSHGRLRL
jgi:hypothetical protein